MKNATLLACLIALATGCGHKTDSVYVGSDGSKVTVDHDRLR